MESQLPLIVTKWWYFIIVQGGVSNVAQKHFFLLWLSFLYGSALFIYLLIDLSWFIRLFICLHSSTRDAWTWTASDRLDIERCKSKLWDVFHLDHRRPRRTIFISGCSVDHLKNYSLHNVQGRPCPVTHIRTYKSSRVNRL